MNRIPLAAIISLVIIALSMQSASAAQAGPTNTASGSNTKACTAGDYKCDYKIVDGSPQKDLQGLVCMRDKPCNYTCPADQGGGTITGACLAEDSCEAETTCNGQAPQKYTTQQIQSALNGGQSNGTNANAIVSQDFQSFPSSQSDQTVPQPSDQSGASSAGGSSSNLPTSPPEPSWVQSVGAANPQNTALPYANQSVLTQALNSLQGGQPPGSQTTDQTAVPTTPEQYLQSTFGTTQSGEYQSSGVSSVATNYMQTLSSGDTAYIIPPNDPLNQEIQANLSDANAVTNSNFTVVAKLSDGSLALLPGDQYGINGSGYAGVNASGLKNDNLTGSGLNYPLIAAGMEPAPQAESQKLDYMLEGESYYGTSASSIFSSQNSGTGATVGQDLSQLMSNSSAQSGFGTWVSDNMSFGSPMMAVSGTITNSSGETSNFSSNVPIPTSNVAPPINPNNTVYVELSPPASPPDTTPDWQPSADQTVVPPLPAPITVPVVPEMQPVDQTTENQGSDVSQTQTQPPASQPAGQQTEQVQTQQPPPPSETPTPPPQEAESQASPVPSDTGASGKPTGSGPQVSSGGGGGGGTQAVVTGGATGGSSLNVGGSSAGQILGSLISGLSGFFGGAQPQPAAAPTPVVYSATEPIVSIPATSDGLLGPCSAHPAQTNAQQQQPCGATSNVPVPQLVSSLPLARANGAPASSQQNNATIPQTIIPGTTQNNSGNAVQPGGATQTTQQGSPSTAPVGSPSQLVSAQGNNTPVNPSGTQQGPTGAPNPAGSQRGGAGALSTTPGGGGAPQPNSNPQTSPPQVASTQPSGQGSASGSSAGSKNPSASGGAGVGSGSQAGEQNPAASAQPESLFQQVLRFVSDSIVAPAVASEGNGRIQLLNRLNAAYGAFEDASQRASAAGKNPSALPPLKEAIAAGQRVVNLSRELLHRNDIGNGYKTSIGAIAARVQAQAAPISRLINEFDHASLFAKIPVGNKMSQVFPTAIPAALKSIDHLYKTSVEALQHPPATIGPIGHAPGNPPAAAPVATNAVNQPNPNPVTNPTQNNPAPPAQTQPAQNPSPAPAPATAPQPRPGNINSASDRTAVAQQAYHMAMSQGIRPNELVPGNPNYGKAWNSLVQDVRQSLGSRGMLNPQLDTAFIAAVARQETDVPGNPGEFQSPTGVRGVMQVTTGDAHSVLGYGSVNTWAGPLNTATFAREDNMGSVITAAIELNGLLFQYGGNMSAAAQVYNSGSTSSCVGGGCVGGVPTYGPRVQYDANVMRNAQQSCNGDASCIAGKLSSLSQGRSRNAQSFADFASILSGSNAPIVCAFQGCAANPSIKPGNASYAQGIGRVSSCPSSGYCYYDPQTGAYGAASDQTMTKQQFLQASREDDAIERLVQSGKLTAQQASQDSFQDFKATPTGAEGKSSYTITDSSGKVLAKNVPLPEGSVGADGTVRLLADGSGQPLGEDGTTPLSDGVSPLLVSSNGTLPQPTPDQNNPNQQNFPDNRPAAPQPPPGTYAPPPVVQNGNQRYCLANYQPYVWTPCSANGLSPSFPIQPLPPMQQQPQPISQLTTQPYIPPATTPGAATSTPAAAVAITANPASVESGGTAKVSWSSVGTVSCSVLTSSGYEIGTTTKGSVFSPKLSTTTAFTATCQTPANSTVATSTSVIVR